MHKTTIWWSHEARLPHSVTGVHIYPEVFVSHVLGPSWVDLTDMNLISVSIGAAGVKAKPSTSLGL